MRHFIPAYLNRFFSALTYAAGFFICFVVPVAAQHPHPHPAFRQYTVEDGMASSVIYQIRQDSKGYIWFATGNGVSRFNGYEFQNFSVKEGLSDNTVFEIQEDKNGHIWFCPLSCQLSWYDYTDGKIHPYAYNHIIDKTVTNPFKASFSVEDDGTVFLGLYGAPIYKFSPGGQVSGYFGVIADTLCVLSLPSGRYHFTQSSWIRREKPDDWDFNVTAKIRRGTRETVVSLGPAKRLMQYRFGRVIGWKGNNLLISLGNVLFRLQNDRLTGTYTFPTIIHWMYEDRDGDLWIGTYQDGVYLIQNEDFENKKHYLPNTIVNAVLQDHEGGFWFGTDGNSVFYTPSKNILAYDHTNLFDKDRVNSLATDGRNVYAGVQDGKIYIFGQDGQLAQFDTDDGINNANSVTSIYCDTANRELFYSAVFTSGRMSTETLAKKSFGGAFYRMKVDPNGNHWFSHPRGMGIWHVNRKYVRNAGITKRVYAIQEWRNDTFLAGSIDGLWLFHKRDSSYTSLQYHPLLRNRISDIEITPDSMVLIGTKGAGLLICTKDRLVQVSTGNGLSDEQINNIYIEGYTAWVATNKGVSRVDLRPRDPSSFSVSRYTVSEGLISNEVNDLVVCDKKLWIATNKGLSVLPLDLPGGHTAELPLYIDRISVNGRDTAGHPYYELRYNENNIRIGYTALEYQHAGRLHYRYRMEGLNPDWTYTDNREIQFTTLPPGKYTFTVAALDMNGEWSRKTASVTFMIYAPVWKKWWFQVVAVAVIVLLVVLLMRYIAIRGQLRKEKSENLNRNLLNLKLKALRAQMNPHFTFNVMNSIQHFILHRNEESAHRYLSKFSKLMRAILNNSEKDTVSIAEEIKALELYLELESMRFEQGFSYAIVIDRNIDVQRVHIPSMLIQPFVENALIHGILPSQKKGKLTVEIRLEDNRLLCIIEDNGVGRAKAMEKKKAGHKSFGTSITKERLSTINALHNSTLSEKTIDLYDASGQATGTRVEIYIPLMKPYEDESDHY